MTTGRSKAAAKWRGPLSVVTSRSARRTQAFVNPSEAAAIGAGGLVAERMHGRMLACGRDHARQRPLGRATQHQDAAAALFGEIAGQGGEVVRGQCLAAPNAAPGLRQITSVNV